MQEIGFSLPNNAQFYTGNNVGGLTESTSGWTTQGTNNRRAQMRDENNLVYDAMRSQEIDGKIVLWVNDKNLPTSTSQVTYENYAVVVDNTNFEHIWSSWRGQRWVEDANVDDNHYSFQDCIEFGHAFDVQQKIGSEYLWIDEWTLDLSNDHSQGQYVTEISLKTKEGWSAQFSNGVHTTTMRGGGDSHSWGSGELHLDFTQQNNPDDGVWIHTDDETEYGSSEPLVYDESNPYEGEQIVDETTVTYAPVEPIEGATAISTNYDAGDYTIKLSYYADNVETFSENEERWVLATWFPDGTRHPVGQFNLQSPAQNAFDEEVQKLTTEFDLKNSLQTEQNELSEQVTDILESKQEERTIPIQEWGDYINPTESQLLDDNYPFLQCVVKGQHDVIDDGDVLRLNNTFWNASGALKIQTRPDYEVTFILGTQNNDFFLDNLTDISSADTRDTGGDVDLLHLEEMGVGLNSRNLHSYDIVRVTLRGSNSRLDIDVDSEFADINNFMVNIEGTDYQIAEPENMNNEFFIMIDSIKYLGETPIQQQQEVEPPVTPPVIEPPPTDYTDLVAGIVVSIVFILGLLALASISKGESEA